MKAKSLRSFGEFNESVFSDEGHAGMPGEMYDNESKSSFTLEDMEKCWRAATRRNFDTGTPLYSSFEDWFETFKTSKKGGNSESGR